MDLWGPPTTPVRHPWHFHHGALPESARPSKKDRAGTWGLSDVAFGFFLLLVLNVALGGVALSLSLARLVNQPGLDTTNGSALMDASVKDMTRLLTSGPGVLAGGLTMWAAFFLAPWLATRRKGAKSLAVDFGFRFRWRRDLLAGAGFAIGLRVIEWAVTAGLTAAGVNMSTAGNSNMITDLSGPWLVIDAFIVAAIGAPIFEELFFRGLVFGAFLKNFTRDRDGAAPQSSAGRWATANVGPVWTVWASYRAFLYRLRVPLAVVLSSVLFGVLHYQGSNTFGSWFVVGTTTSIGMFLAAIRYRTGRLGMTICTHVLFNASGVALAVLSQR